jgi:putative endonuclease
MKAFNRETGRIGEEAAARYLIDKGYSVFLRNFHTRFGEIDLICRDKNMLIFVEVKAKKGVEFGLPEEMFTRYKYAKVRRMAEVYLQGKEVPCRIDMIAVELKQDNTVGEIRHYENVTQP